MIDSIAGFLQHNLIVLLAVVLVPMKFGILRICGDRDAQKIALISIPEDLVYVSLGLVLGDFATSGGAFRKHFLGSTHVPMDLFVTILVGVIVAILVHVFAKWTNDQLNNWRAASQVRINTGSADPDQQELPFVPDDENVRIIQFRHLSGASVMYLIQLVVTVRWLAWIAKIIAAS